MRSLEVPSSLRLASERLESWRGLPHVKAPRFVGAIAAVVDDGRGAEG